MNARTGTWWRVLQILLFLWILLLAESVFAWTPELKRALFNMYLGNATHEQVVLVRRNIDVVNRMAQLGYIPDKVYQVAQRDFANFNVTQARTAAGKNGLTLRVQTQTKPFTPGTDSDYITHSRTGRMTPEQIRKTIADYNQQMNRYFGTRDVKYAQKFDTDLMADPKQMTAEEFKAVSKLNNDAYKRRASAAYEAKIRELDSPATLDELGKHQRELSDLIEKEGHQIKDLEKRLEAAIKGDPKAVKPSTRDLEAELQLHRQQQAEYVTRYDEFSKELGHQHELNDSIRQKGDRIQELEKRLAEALKVDPQAVKPSTRKLEAELHSSRRELAENVTKYTESTRRITQKYGVKHARTQLTLNETIEYQRDMNDLIEKKGRQIRELEKRLAEALKADPKAAKPSTRNLEAELQLRQQQQAKYITRYNESTRRLAQRYGVNCEPPASEIPNRAADRSMDVTRGMTPEQKSGLTEVEEQRLQGELATRKRLDTSAMKATRQHVIEQMRGGKVMVNSEAAHKLSLEVGGSPDALHMIDEAARELARMPPARQGELIEEVRRRFGDTMAKKLAARTRVMNSQTSSAKGAADAKGKMTKWKETGGRLMQVMAIASLANEARAWIKGEKSNMEAAKSALNMLTSGHYYNFENLSGWKQTYDANYQAFVNERQARIYRIGKDLYDRGVPLEEVKRIVRDLENGSEGSLDRKISELAQKGIRYQKPPPVKRTYFSDTSWKDYFKGVGHRLWDAAKDLVISPFKLAWDTGKDLRELTLLTTDIFLQHRNIKDAYLQLIELQNHINARKLIRRLLELGATADEAKHAVDDWLAGKAGAVRGLRNLLKLLQQPEEKVMRAIRQLGNKKLMQTLKAMNIEPPRSLLDCLCSEAGYGAMGTAQFYHPDTIGNYNPAYSCNQPGPPCVVQGFGCTRHPLPSSADIWERCMAGNLLDVQKNADGQVVPGSGRRFDKVILEVLRKRRK